MSRSKHTTISYSNNKKTSPFIRVPNYIIDYSIKNNKYILPLYLYSAINNNPFQENIVNTNIALISDTFAPDQRLVPMKFKASLSSLINEEQESFSPPLQLLYASGIKIDAKANPAEEITKISNSAHLQYMFLDRDIKMDNNWTLLYFDEYFYLLNATVQRKQTITKQKRAKYNTIELFNLYMYFKHKIQLYSLTQSKLRRELNSNITCEMHESLETICKNTNLARNTLTKYINQLSDLGMLNISKGKYNAKDKDANVKTPNTYTLSNEWRE